MVLPKCPYCFVAYSSAISICGLPTQNTYHWEHLLILGLISIIAVSLLKRNRGKQTLIAMTVLVLGSLLIWLSVAQGLIQGYYWGAGLIFLSTLINRKIMWNPAWFKSY